MCVFWQLFKCAIFPPLYFALLQCSFGWMENFPRVVFSLPFQLAVWHLLASVGKMCFRVQRGAHVNPFLKSTQGCTFLAQSALSKLLPLSNGKGHIAEPFRRTSSPASLFWVLQKRGIEILTEGLEKYLDGSNGGTFDSSEQRQALSLPDVLSVEKTKLQRDKAKENKKTLKVNWPFLFIFFTLFSYS